MKGNKKYFIFKKIYKKPLYFDRNPLLLHYTNENERVMKMKKQTFTVELHTKEEKPEKYIYPDGVASIFSVLVFMIDEENEAMSACYCYPRDRWEDSSGEPINIDFKWFYKPDNLNY